MIGSMSVGKVAQMAKAQAEAKGLPLSKARRQMALAAVKETIAHRRHHRGWTILSYGMGVDSTAIILKLLEDGLEAHGIDRRFFVIITSQTGNEFPDLKPLVETHVLPRLRKHGVRYVQIARSDASTKGYTVLSDTTAPKRLELEGAYTVRDEYVSAGTIPQSGGEHLCSIKSKANPLEELIWDITGGEDYAHIIGFEAGETGRALKDVYMGRPERLPWYPLIEWDWDRATCLDFIEAMTGARWVKSCCWFCPFAGQGTEKDELALRWSMYPHLGADTLLVEYMALALNPRQTLFGMKSAWLFARDRGLDNVLEAYEHLLEKSQWAVYRVRRIWTGPGVAQRGVDIEATGNMDQMLEALEYMAKAEGAKVVEDKFAVLRAIHKDKPKNAGIEHFLVASPMGMTEEKFGRVGGERFDARWKAAIKKYGRG